MVNPPPPPTSLPAEQHDHRLRLHPADFGQQLRRLLQQVRRQLGLRRHHLPPGPALVLPEDQHRLPVRLKFVVWLCLLAKAPFSFYFFCCPAPPFFLLFFFSFLLFILLSFFLSCFLALCQEIRARRAVGVKRAAPSAAPAPARLAACVHGPQRLLVQVLRRNAAPG